jgi:hypothetical protein
MKKFLKRLLLFMRDLLAPFAHFQEVCILCYHSISENAHNTAVAERDFERQLMLLKNKGHAFIPLADVLDWMDGKKELPRKAVALTFDDGYADFETAALPILKKFNAPAELFYIFSPAEQWDAPLLGPWALERLRREPLVELGWHSRGHPNMERLSAEELAAEVTPPRPVRFFAYPGGTYSKAAVEALRSARGTKPPAPSSRRSSSGRATAGFCRATLSSKVCPPGKCAFMRAKRSLGTTPYRACCDDYGEDTLLGSVVVQFENCLIFYGREL